MTATDAISEDIQDLPCTLVLSVLSLSHMHVLIIRIEEWLLLQKYIFTWFVLQHVHLS